MADKIQVPIESTYDDKGAKQALADAKKLDTSDPTVDVDANTSQATHDITGLMQKVDLLDADTATILLTSNATKIAGQITDLVVDLDKLDSADPTVEVKAEQINSLKGDLDQIESKIKEVNNVPVDIDTKPARKGTEDLAKSIDSSKSVYANMVGNATQDVGALAGVAGSAGVAIGQMGEYMVDAKNDGDNLGDVLRNFGKIAVPIAAITVATAALGSIFQDIENRAKRAQEQVKAFTNKLGDTPAATSAVADLSGQLQRFDADARTAWGGFLDGVAGAVKAIPVLGGLVGDAGQNVSNLIPVFNKLGITAEDIGKAAAKGGAGWDELRVSVAAAGEAGMITSDQASAVDQALEGFEHSAKTASETSAFLSSNVSALNAAYKDAINPMQRYADLQQEAADQLDRVTQKLQDEAAALNDQVDASTTAADAQRDENKALKDYAAKLGDAKASTDDVADSAISLAKAHATTVEAQAKATGATITATQKVDAQNDALLNTAATAKGPARDAILGYIGDLNQIPPEKRTEIQAAINAGDLDTAKRLLGEASGPRTAAIRADADTAAAERELGPNGVSRDRTSTVTAQVKVNGITAIGGGKYRLDNGVIVQGAPTPPNGGALPTPLPAGGGVTNVTLNVPRGTRPDDMVRAADRYARRNGSAHARRR